MKVMVLTPFGAVEPGASDTLRRAARPDCEVVTACVEEAFPLRYNTYRYNTLKCTDAAVERIIAAEAEGYDAVVVSCTFDPGVLEAREVVDIPVVGIMEASASLAGMMGQAFSIIAPEQTAAATLRRLLATYGLKDKCASVRHIGIVARDLYPDRTPAEEVLTRLARAAAQCRDDGAEVIIPGCSIIGAVLTTAQRQGNSNMAALLSEFLVIDPMIAGLKTAEMLVDFCRATGLPPVSRAGLWARQPAGEYAELRAWLMKRPSPLRLYGGGEEQVKS